MTPHPQCHRGAMNGGCGFVGRPHPSYSFIAPILWSMKLLGQPEKNSDRRNFSGWKINVCKMKGFIHWELQHDLWEPYGNLQNPTQMLSYDQLKFYSFHGWSTKGTSSWWLVALALWEGRGRDSILAVGIISSTSPFIEGLSLKIFILDS